MTIEELYAENDGREGVQQIINQINSKHEIWGELTMAEKEVIWALWKNIQKLRSTSCAETWNDVTSEKPCGEFAAIYRVKPDYTLPAAEPKVIWGERQGEDYAPSYILPQHHGKYAIKYDQLAGWAEANGWEFHGFWVDKEMSETGEMIPWHYTVADDRIEAKIEICPWAKFVKK